MAPQNGVTEGSSDGTAIGIDQDDLVMPVRNIALALFVCRSAEDALAGRLFGFSRRLRGHQTSNCSVHLVRL